MVNPEGGEVGGEDEIDDLGEHGGDDWWWCCIGEDGSGLSVTRISGLGDLDLGLLQVLRVGGGLVGIISTTCDERRCTSILAANIFLTLNNNKRFFFQSFFSEDVSRKVVRDNYVLVFWLKVFIHGYPNDN